jgi:hypothetical protein
VQVSWHQHLQVITKTTAAEGEGAHKIYFAVAKAASKFQQMQIATAAHGLSEFESKAIKIDRRKFCNQQ